MESLIKYTGQFLKYKIALLFLYLVSYSVCAETYITAPKKLIDVVVPYGQTINIDDDITVGENEADDVILGDHEITLTAPEG